LSGLRDIEAALSRAGWLRRPETQQLLHLLDGASRRTRAVGGVVRDTVLEMARADSEIDLATELLPDEVTARAQRAGLSVHPTGIEHGTVTIELGGLIAEVTTLRQDVATDGRHARVSFGTDWVRDAERRDFTLNALYADIDGRLFDPLGGLGDCLAQKVRFVGEPARRIAEDRLRVYRFFRFSASHGKGQLDPEGLAACGAAAGDLTNLSAERVGAEMRRMLQVRRIATILKAMDDVGLLPFGSGQIELQHRYERRARRPEYAARLALLLSGIEESWLRERWRLSNDDLRTAGAVLDAARLLIEFRLYEAAYRHPAAITDAVEVAAALADWTEAGRLAVTDQLEGLDVPRFPVSGDDLTALGMEPGRPLGAALDRLERAWIESGFTLDRTELLARLGRGR
jgi:poly(A) polymerase